MYHFIRRFFLFVLIFACCFLFTRSGYPQYPTGWELGVASLGSNYGVGGVISNYGMGDNGWGFPSSSSMGYFGIGLLSTLNIEQQSFGRSLQQGAVIPTNALMYTQLSGQPLLDVWHTPVSSIARTSFANYTGNQQNIPNIVSQFYPPGVETVGNLLQTSVTRYYSPTSFGTLQPSTYLQGTPYELIPSWSSVREQDAGFTSWRDTSFYDSNKPWFKGIAY